MSKLNQKDAQNKKLSQLEGSDRVFAERKHPDLVAQVVRYQMAKHRRGTHEAQTRSFVSRTGAKPFAQKGTGRARRGDERAPGLEGGGVVFPPQSRDHSFSLPKKVRKAAVRSVLSDKQRHEKLTILTDHGLTAIKTKEAKALVERLGLNNALFVLPKKDEIFEKSLRNLPQVKALRVEGLNVYDLLNHEEVVIFKEALPLIEKRFQ